MQPHDHAMRNGALQEATEPNGTPRNPAPERDAPRGLGPNGAPWTYPEKRFEPAAFSPNLSLTPLNQLETKAPVWECGGRLRRGAVTIVAGEHGSGKSLLGVEWAARVTRGESNAERRLSLHERTTSRAAKSDHSRGEAVIAHACDLPLDSLRRRIGAAGGAPGRIASLALAHPDDDKPFTIETIRRRVISLASAVRGTADIRVLVIDNLEAWAGNYHEPPSAMMLGFLLAQLTDLAMQAEVAIVALAQLPRAGGQAAARKLDQLTALAPVVYLAASDPERPSRKLLLPVKNNLAPPAAASFEVAGERVMWSETPIDASADEFIVPLSRRLEARHERESAARWLLDALADGPIESRELFRQARECGIATRTLRRAAQSFGLSPRKTSFRGPWQWRLGEAGANGQSAAAEPGADRRLLLCESASFRGAQSDHGRGDSNAESRSAQGGQPRGAVLAAAAELGADRRLSLCESTSFRGAKSDHGRGDAEVALTGVG